MLVLSRKKDESIVINNNVKVVVVAIAGDKVRLGVEAPRDVSVHRNEVWEAIQRNKPASAEREKVGRKHEFDSSRTCNYCGIAAERVDGIAENEDCPARNRGKS